MDYNYFEVLELSIDDIQGKDETTIKDIANAAHTKLYTRTIGAFANVPRPDGLTQAQWQKVLNDAKETLLDPRKRREHIADLVPEPEATHAPETTEIPEPESTQAPETTEIPEPEATHAPETTWTAWIAIYTGQLFIAICIWRTLFNDPDSWRFLGGAAISVISLIVISFYILSYFADKGDGIIKDIVEDRKTEFLLGVITLALLPVVGLIEHVFSGSNFGPSTLFFHPLFILCALLVRIGFIQYCWRATYILLADHYPLISIAFLSGCIKNRKRWPLIVIFAGAFAGALVSSGIVADFIRTSSSYNSLDFLNFNVLEDVLVHFLKHFLICLFLITPFVRVVVYRGLWAMIKRLIMILAPIAAVPFTEVISSSLQWEGFWRKIFLFLYRSDSLLLPSALIIFSYYIVGYIRYIRSVR